MNIVHVHSDSEDELGGGYTVLENLVQRTEGRVLAGGTVRNRIAILGGSGLMSGHLAAAGIPVTPLNLYRLPGGPVSGFLRLTRLIRRSRPVIVNCWITRANLLAGLAVRLTGRAPLLWTIHNQAPVSIREDIPRVLRGLTARLCAPLSHHMPDAIVYVSNPSRQAHEMAGYDRRKTHVIPLGIDLEQFRPDPQARSSVRRELGLADATPIVGLMARFVPYKDHALFLAAFARLKTGNAHAVLCGLGENSNNPELIGMVNEAGVADRVHLLGLRDDIPRLVAAWDVAVSSAWAVDPLVNTEAFCLAIGEALGAGVPCVTTDIGDITQAVARGGRVVHSRNPADLADAIDGILAMAPEERRALGRHGREEVARRFGMDAHIEKSMILYEALAETIRSR